MHAHKLKTQQLTVLKGDNKMHGNYTVDYIQRARTSEQLEQPRWDLIQAHKEVYEALYNAHKAGGAASANIAWSTLIRMNPDFAALAEPSKLIYADDLKYLTRPSLYLDDYPIYMKGLNAIVGESGAGKSFVCLDIAARVAVSRQMKVIYIAAEGLHGYSGRWEAWKKHHQVEGSENLIFYPEAVDFMDMEAVSKFTAEIKAHKPALVILDTIARCMISGDENSTKDMGLMVAHLDHMNRELDCGSLVVHHTGKDGKMRGNTALKGACDSVMFLTANDGMITLSNQHDAGGKNKHAAEIPPRYMRLLPIQMRVNDELWDSAVVVESEKIIKPQTPDELDDKHYSILQSLEARELGLLQKDIADATGISTSTVNRRISQLIEMGYVQQLKIGSYALTDEGNSYLGKA